MSVFIWTRSAKFHPVLYLLPALLLLCGASAPARAETGYGSGLLWEIGAAGRPSCYLFGTIHSEDRRVLQLTDPVSAAFEASENVVLEILLDREAMTHSSAIMLMPHDQRLSGLLGETLFGKTAAAIQARGISAVVLERMKPWAAATTLSMPTPETGQVLDLVLYQRALRSGQRVYGLETVREQLDIFDSMPLHDQILLLQDVVEQFDGLDEMHQDLLEAYLAGDLARLMDINEQALQDGDPRLAADFQRRVIVERNHRMAKRMEPYLGEGRAFIAVGALHLPGEQGLLNLLEQRGYTVRAVY